MPIRRWPSARRWSVAARAPASGSRTRPGILWSSGMARVDDDEGEPWVRVREAPRRLGREDEDGAVGRPAEEPLDQRGFTIVLMEGRAQDGAHLLLVEGLGRPERIHGSSRRGRTGSSTRSAPSSLGERPRGTVGREAQGAHVLAAPASRVSGATSGRSLTTRETVPRRRRRTAPRRGSSPDGASAARHASGCGFAHLVSRCSDACNRLQ